MHITTTQVTSNPNAFTKRYLLKKFGAAYGCRKTGATSEAKEIYRGSISVCKS